MRAYLDDTDPLVWNIFQAAYRASVFPVPVCNRSLSPSLIVPVANEPSRTRC
jgi:hypothetical protein